jgi:hypothetical protein
MDLKTIKEYIDELKQSIQKLKTEQITSPTYIATDTVREKLFTKNQTIEFLRSIKAKLSEISINDLSIADNSIRKSRFTITFGKDLLVNNNKVLTENMSRVNKFKYYKKEELENGEYYLLFNLSPFYEPYLLFFAGDNIETNLFTIIDRKITSKYTFTIQKRENTTIDGNQ